MERCGRHLETQPDEHQRDRHVGQDRCVASVERLADLIDIGRTGGTEHQRDSIEEEGSGKRSE